AVLPTASTASFSPCLPCTITLNGACSETFHRQPFVAKRPSMNRPKRVAILGSTGSVGRQTLDVIRANPNHLQVVGLAAGRNQDLLAQQVAEFHPRMIATSESIKLGLVELAGVDVVSMVEMATDPEVDVVLAGVVGKVGLEPILAALEAGKAVALANKEAMVM